MYVKQHMKLSISEKRNGKLDFVSKIHVHVQKMIIFI